MATQRVTAQQKYVHAKHKRADTNAKIGEFPIAVVIKKERGKRVERQDEQEYDRKVQKIPMDVLQNQWQGIFAKIVVARFADGTRRGVRPKRFVIRAPVVIASHPEASRKRKDQ